jgi:ubiquinone/menaquinone biosynthesis C-methylase UbiE
MKILVESGIVSARNEGKWTYYSISSNGVIVAKSKHPDMDFQLSPCENMPFDSQTFDVLIACMAYHHFADKKDTRKL